MCPAWRFELPSELIGVFSINLLEFIAASLTIQLAVEYRKNIKKPHRILAFTDSSSALGGYLNQISIPRHMKAMIK